MSAIVRKNKLEIAMRRRRVAAMFLKGYSDCTEIADALNETPKVIAKDVEIIKEEWRTESVEDYAFYVNQMAAKIDAVEREAWKEWEESKKEKVIKTTEREMEGAGETGGEQAIKSQRLELKTEKRCGDPRYMEVIQWCYQQRLKLYGLDVLRVAQTTPDGQQEAHYTLAVQDMTRETIMQAVDAARQQFGSLDPRRRITNLEN